MGWFKYLSIFAITAIFSLCLIVFISNIEYSNNAQQNILDSPQLLNLKGSMNVFLNNLSTAGYSQYNASASEQVAAPTGAFIMYSILTSLGRLILMPLNLVYSLFTVISEVLGVDPAILAGITALILLAGIFYWYKTVKTGD